MNREEQKIKKEYARQYYSRPEIKERKRQYDKQYRSKSEVKERAKQYYLRKKQENMKK